jgi:hypothetical protein
MQSGQAYNILFAAQFYILLLMFLKGLLDCPNMKQSKSITQNRANPLHKTGQFHNIKQGKSITQNKANP